MKIKIQGDKVSDAGGLLWEWMHLIVAEIFHPNTGTISTQLKGLFTKCDSDDVSYKINSDADQDEHIIACFGLVGSIIGKSLFERIPLNAYIDRTLIKLIL